MAKQNSKPRVLVGDQAIAAVEALEGRTLSPIERRVVQEEGFVDGTYKDTKGILTGGVGQTGKWLQKGFGASFRHHVDRVKGRIPDFEHLSAYLQEELVQAEYRGDIGGSPKTVSLINTREYHDAAVEFLDNAEYRNPKTPKGIKRRMKTVSDALLKYGRYLNGFEN